jgi:hypothetical protein
MGYFKRLWILILMVLAGGVGCTPKTNDGVTPLQPTSTTIFTNPWVLYHNVLLTGEGVLTFWGNGTAQNQAPAPVQTINFSDNTVSAYDGTNSLSYTTSNWYDWTYAGMILINTPDYTTYNASNGWNLSSGGFTQCTFWTRANVVGGSAEFEASNSSCGNPCLAHTYNLTTQWTQHTLGFTNNTNVAGLFQISITSTGVPVHLLPSTIYVDDITYE